MSSSVIVRCGEKTNKNSMSNYSEGFRLKLCVIRHDLQLDIIALFGLFSGPYLVGKYFHG